MIVTKLLTEGGYPYGQNRKNLYAYYGYCYGCFCRFLRLLTVILTGGPSIVTAFPNS
jgi:hypothetical protein